MNTSELSPTQDSQHERPPRRPWQIGLGVVSIFTGIVLGLLMVRGLLLSNLKADAWNISGVLVFCLLAAFLVWIGARSVRRGRGQKVPKPAIRWGRMLGGVWLVFFSLHSYLYPGPKAYKAANASEGLSMLLITLLMTLGGIILIVSSLKALWGNAYAGTSQTGFQG